MRVVEIAVAKMAVCLGLILLWAVTPSTVAFAASFAGSNTGTIPDNDPAGRTVNFTVSGATTALEDISLSLTLNHTWVSDLEVMLTSPNGTSSLLIFGRAGMRQSGSSGQSANLAGTYVFHDDAIQDFWASFAGAATSFNIPPGTYRTTTQGRQARASTVATNAGGCSTFLRGAFGQLPASKVNGVWTLRLVDRVATDVGTIDAATLTLNFAPSSVFANGFEGGAVVPDPLLPYLQGSSVRGSCIRPNYDFTGTGLSSFVTVRNTGGGAGGAVTWFVTSNVGGAAGTANSFLLGDSTNFFISGDFDGDGIDDATVWKTGAPGVFRVRRSSRPNDLLQEVVFGTTGDDPTHIGDYDGDGIADATVSRAGATAGDPTHTLILLSSTGQVRDLVTGSNGQFPNGGVDYNGDGRADMAMQSNAGGGAARITLFSGMNGTEIGNFLLGTPTDVMVAGNHSGNAIADLTVTRASGGVIQWTTRDTVTGVTAAAVPWGASATDFGLSGDYDGDGLDDYAVWHPSATVGESKFILRPSLTPASTVEINFGQNGDYPVARSRSH